MRICSTACCIYRTSKFMDLLESKTSLTRAGKLCITKMLDPFHDTEVPLGPIPDGNTRPVITQEIRSSVQITTNGDDLSIALLPFHFCNTAGLNDGERFTYSVPETLAYKTAGSMSTTTLWNNHVVVGATPLATGTAFTTGFLDVRLRNSGGKFYPDGSSDFPDSRVVVLPNTQPTGAGLRRLLAVGLELHNTTADLYKQGTITCYRKPVSYGHLKAHHMAAMPPVGRTMNALGPDVDHEIANLPEDSVGRAMAYPGSTQWEASKGAYVVATIADLEEQDLCVNSTGFPGMEYGDFSSYPNWVGTNVFAYDYRGRCNYHMNGVAPGNEPEASYTFRYPEEYIRTGMNTSGILATGLSAQTTFTLTVKAIWEFAPSLGDSSVEQLVWLAKTPPPLDPTFVEMYQAAAVQLPAAVPVNENPEGEWWRKVESIIQAVLPYISTLEPAGKLLTCLGCKAVRAPSGQWGDIEDLPRVSARPRPSSRASSRSGRSSSVGSRGSQRKVTIRIGSGGIKKKPKKTKNKK